MGIFRGPGGTGDATNDAANEATLAIAAAQAAELSKNDAANSAAQAATSASNASTSAGSASSSATSASNSASNALTSANNAANAEAGALSSASLAATSETNAASSASAAAVSAANALVSANNASSSASNAATSATNSANSASAASTSASNAAISESNASTSELNASNSASSALSSENAASASASTASTQATNASNSASAAFISETNAANSASAASTSASNASNSESAASISESNAANSASAASTSASNAAISETNAANLYDEFDDRYLGAKTSDPTLDNDGDALITGALYFNTPNNEIRVWTGTNWVAISAFPSGTINDLTIANTLTLTNQMGLKMTNTRPSIRPSLLLDFANVKQLDPRVTFARASTARYYDGKTVAKAEENLLLRSQDYSATWSVTNLTPVTGKTAPDATTTATEFTASAGNATLTQSVTAIAGDYTFSVFLRRVSGTGNVDISAHSAGTWVTQTLTSTWTRFTVTQTLTAGARTPGIRVVTSGDVIEVWGAQLEQRSTVTAYTATTTQPITNYIPVLLSAANNEARFDHNPTTSESLGLLIEEQRTNLLLRSEEFDNADWTKTRASITANTIVSPDGTLTGDKLVENTDTNTHLTFSLSITSLATTAYTGTVYVKAGERNFISIQYNSASFGGVTTRGFIDLLSGAISNVNNCTVTATAVGNGWYRCSITATTTVGGGLSLIVNLSTSGAGAGTTYTGDGFSGIYLWGAQLEAGAFPTSYILTVASQVTRSADVQSGTNLGQLGQGTFYIDATVRSGNTLITSGATTFSATAGTRQKTAVAYNTTDTRKSINGATVTSTAGTQGGSNITIANGATGHINKIALYPQKLTDINLQALTT